LALDQLNNYPPILDSIENYMPCDEDVFICAMGGKAKRICTQKILDRGGHFINLIHSTARLGSNVVIGSGNIIGAYVSLGSDVHLGDYNMIQSYSVIGHDASIGNWVRIDTHSICVGGTKIEDHVTIHTNAVINHNVVVESNAHVGACSFVIRRVKSNTTVFGNPAKILDL